MGTTSTMSSSAVGRCSEEKKMKTGQNASGSPDASPDEHKFAFSFRGLGIDTFNILLCFVMKAPAPSEEAGKVPWTAHPALLVCRVCTHWNRAVLHLRIHPFAAVVISNCTQSVLECNARFNEYAAEKRVEMENLEQSHPQASRVSLLADAEKRLKDQWRCVHSAFEKLEQALDCAHGIANEHMGEEALKHWGSLEIVTIFSRESVAEPEFQRTLENGEVDASWEGDTKTVLAQVTGSRNANELDRPATPPLITVHGTVFFFDDHGNEVTMQNHIAYHLNLKLNVKMAPGVVSLTLASESDTVVYLPQKPNSQAQASEIQAFISVSHLVSAMYWHAMLQGSACLLGFVNTHGGRLNQGANEPEGANEP